MELEALCTSLSRQTSALDAEIQSKRSEMAGKERAVDNLMKNLWDLLPDTLDTSEPSNEARDEEIEGKSKEISDLELEVKNAKQQLPDLCKRYSSKNEDYRRNREALLAEVDYAHSDASRRTGAAPDSASAATLLHSEAGVFARICEYSNVTPRGCKSSPPPMSEYPQPQLTIGRGIPSPPKPLWGCCKRYSFAAETSSGSGSASRRIWRLKRHSRRFNRHTVGSQVPREELSRVQTTS